MILAVMKAIYAIAYVEAWKIQDFNGIWNCDLVIPVWCSNQLKYEATDVESWSFVKTTWGTQRKQCTNKPIQLDKIMEGTVSNSGIEVKSTTKVCFIKGWEIKGAWQT